MKIFPGCQAVLKKIRVSTIDFQRLRELNFQRRRTGSPVKMGTFVWYLNTTIR